MSAGRTEAVGEPGWSRVAVPALVAAAALAATALVWLAHGRTFYYDEWSWVLERSSGGPRTLLEPHNEHVSIVPVAVYRVLFEVFGLAHNWPFRIPVLLAHLACAGLVFALVRRRMGAAWALIAAVLLLFLGRAWEDLLWGFQLGFMLSVLGGVVAWWALDREDAAGDGVACAALSVGALSSSLGVPVALGVLAETVYGRRGRSLWVPLVPLALYGLWYLGYGDSAIAREGIRHAPRWAADAAAAAAGSLIGRGPDWGRPLLLAGAALAAIAIARRRPTARLAGLLVTGAGFWLLTGAARSAGLTPVPPDASRYTYLGAVVLLLAAAELGRGWTLPRPAWAIAAAVTAVAIASGLGALRDGAHVLRTADDQVKAQIAAATLARDRLADGYHFAPALAPQLVPVSYFAAVAANGSSPVPDPSAELAGAGPPERALADEVFVAADASLEPARGCRRGPGAVVPAGERRAPVGGLTVSAARTPVSVAVRRYGEQPHRLGTIRPHESRRVVLAPDGAPAPWRLRLGAAATVC